jgi:hypothetical protein
VVGENEVVYGFLLVHASLLHFGFRYDTWKFWSIEPDGKKVVPYSVRFMPVWIYCLCTWLVFRFHRGRSPFWSLVQFTSSSTHILTFFCLLFFHFHSAHLSLTTTYITMALPKRIIKVSPSSLTSTTYSTKGLTLSHSPRLLPSVFFLFFLFSFTQNDTTTKHSSILWK